jgi:hypothetical protein
MDIYEKGFGSCISCGGIVDQSFYWLGSYGVYFSPNVSKVFCKAKCSLDFHNKYGITGDVHELEEEFWIQMNAQLARSKR